MEKNIQLMSLLAPIFFFWLLHECFHVKGDAALIKDTCNKTEISSFCNSLFLNNSSSLSANLLGLATISAGKDAKPSDKELLDWIIRVEYAKSLKKPAPPPPPPTETKETRHLVYVSNLPWKVRSGNLREFFSASFKPASARVVFDSPSGRSAGYGFVSFLTEEEALAAISELDGKELMGRPLGLKMSEKKADKSSPKHESEGNADHTLEQESKENGEGRADAP